MLRKSLYTASSPLLNSDIIVHDAIWISAADTFGIPQDGFGPCVWVNEVVSHAKIVTQFMANDLNEIRQIILNM